MGKSEEHNIDDENLLGNDSEDDLFDALAEQNIQPVDMFYKSPRKRLTPCADVPSEFPNKRFKENMELIDIILKHALVFLPAKSLCRFRTVSKEWDQEITSPFFVHRQSHLFRDISGLFCQFPGDKPSFISLNRDAYGIPSPCLSFLPESVALRTTCNGLLCCQSIFGENSYYICNPVNKEWTVLPKSKFYHGPDQSALGLAFQPSTLSFAAHFELVCAFSLTNSTDQPIVSFEIYSSRSSSWRLAETICSELDASKLNGDGIFLKGVIFWETSSGAILVFDLKEEQYGILSLPPKSGPEGVLTEMHGELCYVLPTREGNSYSLEIYGDTHMNLKLIIDLDLGFIPLDELGILRVLAYVNDDVVAVLVGDRVIAYNVKDWTLQSLRDVWIKPLQYYDAGFVKYLPYVNSLVHVRGSYICSLLSEDPTTSSSHVE